MQENSIYGVKKPQTKIPFELRKRSSYGGSSCGDFFYKSLLGNFHGANEFDRVTETFEL